jgi:gamma-glutamylcyclotransferase (GGCT)/AIG2-like uncharacterized protein YtfP
MSNPSPNLSTSFLTSPTSSNTQPLIPSPQNPIPVFVYGTLKPGEFYHAAYCEGRVVAYEEAIAYGQLYALPLGYPAMTEGSNRVYGYLLSLKDSVALDALDELEDYDPHRPALQNEYNRVWIEVFAPTSESRGFAWVYQMSVEQVQDLGGVLLSNGRWSGQEHYF